VERRGGAGDPGEPACAAAVGWLRFVSGWSSDGGPRRGSNPQPAE
jgi:hypothetical protein